MKKIEAIVRPYKLDDIRQALINIEIQSMTILEVKGLGGQISQPQYYRGSEYSEQYIAKLKIEILIEDDKCQQCVDAIASAARTGQVGDGKIIISDINSIIRIRTGEENELAI